MKLLQDKVVMITGSSRGIGRQTALTCAAHGASLVIHGRDEQTLAKLSHELVSRYDTSVLCVSYDVRDREGIKKAFINVQQRFGKLDGFVYNTGILHSRLLGMMDAASLDATIAVNLTAALMHMQYASKFMIRQQSGHIVNVSSIMGVHGEEGHAAYAASKAGLIGATKAAAKELARYQICVNAVAPGFIETDFVSGLTEKQRATRVASIKMGRSGHPRDVANMIVFLCSEWSSYVTGQVIGVDGGMVI
jgi:3-oxoacyl-[acyl-carrier protein] reductase